MRKRRIISGATVVANPDINVTAMSWGMNMGTILKVEVAIPLDDWVFEVWLVNNRGWCGPGNHYDVNELEIARYPAWLYSKQVKDTFTEKEIAELKRSQSPVIMSVSRLEKGELDKWEGIESFKSVLKRFRRLAIFL